MTLQSAWLRRALLILLAGALAFFTWRGFLPWQSLSLLLAMGGLLALLQSRAAPGRRSVLLLGALSGIGFVMLQAGASLAAHERIAALLRQRDPAARLVDAAMTAFPANPVCWSVVALESREDRQSYRVSSGVVSIAPAWLPAAACPAAFVAGDAVARGQGTPAVLLLGQENASLARLRQLARDDCHFNAWMRFARMPVVQGGRAWDARYSSGLRDNFTSIDVADFAGQACERRVPQWRQPRADLLAAPRPAAPLAQQ
jgi:inner membrane protein